MSTLIFDSPREFNGGRWMSIANADVVYVKDMQNGTFDIEKNRWGYLSKGLPIYILYQLIERPILLETITKENWRTLTSTVREEPGTRKLDPDL